MYSLLSSINGHASKCFCIKTRAVGDHSSRISRDCPDFQRGVPEKPRQDIFWGAELSRFFMAVPRICLRNNSDPYVQEIHESDVRHCHCKNLAAAEWVWSHHHTVKHSKLLRSCFWRLGMAVETVAMNFKSLKMYNRWNRLPNKLTLSNWRPI